MVVTGRLWCAKVIHPPSLDSGTLSSRVVPLFLNLYPHSTVHVHRSQEKSQMQSEVQTQMQTQMQTKVQNEMQTEMQNYSKVEMQD